MDVEMPDGTVIEGVPEGTTKAELLRRYQKLQAPQAAAPKGSNEPLWQRMAAESSIPDILMGMRQPIDAGAQMLTRGLSAVGAIPASEAQRVEGINKAAFEDYRKRFNPADTTGGAIARGVGQAVTLAPMLPATGAATIPGTVAKAAGAGALGSALTPVYDVPDGGSFAGEKATQAAMGAVTGGALGAAGRVAAGMISPKLQEGARALLDKKVRLTPGQALGGVTKGIEERAAGYPIVGDVIQSARRQSVSDFNRVLYGKALEPWGEQGAAIAKQAEVGHQGIRAVGEFIGERYEDALARSNPAPLDKPFKQALVKIQGMVPKALRADFVGIVRSNVQATPAGTLTPAALKQAESEIGRLASSYRGSAVAGERELGRALTQAQSELRDLMARHNPVTAAEIRAADQGWRTLVQIENAGSMLGSRDGVITPANFLNAVKRSDKSMRDRVFAKGEAWNQQLAEDAKRVLPQTVPDSGTAGRLGALGMLLEPTTAFKTGLAALPATAAYAPGSSALVRALLTKRPEWAAPIAEQGRAISPYLGLLASGLLSTNQ